MCDPECRKRFIKMEVELATIGNDIRWVKRIGGSLLILLAAFFSVDLSQMAV